MLYNLNWPSLHFRHRISGLQTFYKATYKLSALLSIPSYFGPAQRLTRHSTTSSPTQELAPINSYTFQERSKMGMSYQITLLNQI